MTPQESSSAESTQAGFFGLFKTSLAAQLYGLVAGLTLASFITFYWGHLHSESSGMEQVRLRAATMSLAYAENLSRTLERTDSVLLDLGEHWLKNPHSEPPPDSGLHALLAGQFYDARFEPSAPRSAAPADRLALKVPAPVAGQPAPRLQLIRPIFQGGHLAGQVVVSVAPEFLTQFSNQVPPSSGAALGVLGSEGVLLAHSLPVEPALRSAWVQKAALELPGAPADRLSGMASSEATERTVGLQRMPNWGLTALVSIDVAHQMAPDRKRKHIVFVFALLFPLVLLVATRAILHSRARREALEQTMRDSERLAASVFTHAREGILITDVHGRVLDANTTFTAITGYQREEVIGLPPDMLKDERQSESFYETLRRELLQKGHWSGDIWSRRKDGTPFAALLTISAVRKADGVPQHYVALFTDITEAKDHERQLAHLAHYDALSSLPNRVLLADRLSQAMLQCQRRNKLLTVAFLDLDGFKDVNDRHGHDAGDAMLIAVAQDMKAALRDGDTLARIGGDEFVVVLVDLENRNECYPVLDRLLDAAHRLRTIRHKHGHDTVETQLQISTSIGFTYYPQDGVDADQLLRQADQAMYQAKLEGKNRYHLFDVAIDAELKVRLESIARIRQALEHEEFALYYQPKVNMKTGQVLGAEALIRWNHPERGLLEPRHFLPVIENHALSVALGEWVIQTALHQLELWQAQGLDLCVSVNVSACQLQQESFSYRLGDMLAQYPTVPPARLELEVLETSAMHDMARVTDNIGRCHGLGVQFALDDFGTGYSSLTYLKRFPAHTLKIDQSFVRDMLEDPDDRAIVESVIGLAQSFQRQVIAEGVETLEHGAMLMALGCNLAQGYGIARPMPREALADWVAQWTPNFAEKSDLAHSQVPHTHL